MNLSMSVARLTRVSGKVLSIQCLGSFSLFVVLLIGCGQAGSGAPPVGGGTPPTITSQPIGATVTLGQTATFSVTATGTGTLSYQWKKNSAAITGATTSSYITPATVTGDNGAMFGVVVSNSAGNTASNTVTLTVTSAAPTTFYVDPNGNDTTGDGSKANPFATPGRAQQAMQQSSTKTTIIDAGTYYLTTPLALTSADNGETWQAASGASAVLSGGEVLTGWTSQGDGIYTATAAQPVGLDLTISDVRQTAADIGYNPLQPYISGWRIVNPSQACTTGATISVLPADLTASVKPGAVVQVISDHRYSDNFTTIVSVDAANNTITLANPISDGANCNQPGHTSSWRVLNDPADLSVAGQFAYDPSTSKVYLQPVNSGTLATDTVVAAQLSTLISLTNVSGITISGLTLSDTTSDKNAYSGAFTDQLAAIKGVGLSNSTISGNTFLNVGNGISLSGSSNNTITGNTFNQLGGSGMFLVANSNHNSITKNILTGLGSINAGSTGIHIENSASDTIDSNTINGSGRWGIDLYPLDGVSLTGNVVSNNTIQNTSQQTNDTGAVYSYAGNIAGHVMENTTITGNRIENVGGLDRDGSGNYVQAGLSRGIMMDDHASGVTITKNVIEAGGSQGVLLCNGCKTNTANNNVLILQPPALYDQGPNGITASSGYMPYNGTTRIDLLPSYFPNSVATSTIVVQLSGTAAVGGSAQFNVQADGVVIGSGTASSTPTNYVFQAALTPHQIHRIGIALTNGATSGASTTALNYPSLFVNNTAVLIPAPEATPGTMGAHGLAAGCDDLMPMNFSITHNIVYRNGGYSNDLWDWTSYSCPSYVDPTPGTIDYNVLFQNVAKAIDPVFGGATLDGNSVLTDPLFTNAAGGDYTLRLNSPAFTVGFSTSGVPLAP
jgi:parallel beta-helix repeat protein